MTSEATLILVVEQIEMGDTTHTSIRKFGAPTVIDPTWFSELTQPWLQATDNHFPTLFFVL